MLAIITISGLLALGCGATTAADREDVGPEDADQAWQQDRKPSRRGSSQDTATERAKVFVALLADEHFQQAHGWFDDRMAAALPPAELATAWQGILERTGAYKGIVRAEASPAGAVTIVVVIAACARKQLRINIALAADGRVAGLYLKPQVAAVGPPAYANRGAFTEHQVTVGEAPWRLPGTLAVPDGEGPFPGVVLVHGSGPQDRDETVGGCKPFRDLAWGLASQGVVVLRYDKRTFTHAAKIDPRKTTLREETIADACAAAALLREHEQVDARRVYVIGHSLGAMAAPRIAVADDRIAGVVMLAGPGRHLAQLIAAQADYLHGRQKMSIVAKGVVILQANRIMQGDFDADTAPQELLGIPPVYWQNLAEHDPVQDAVNCPAPMLVLHGARDFQVFDKDFQILSEALRNRDDVTTKQYPKLNHLFVPGDGPGLPAEYDQPGHVDQQVVDDIAAWIKKRGRK
jgi:hypothetical protein